MLPPTAWDVEKQSNTVVIKQATPGHEYQVYFMFMPGSGVCNPLHEPFVRHAIANFDETLKPYAGILDTYWFDHLAFAYPGPLDWNGKHEWDWESYTLAASPENVRRFTQETGVEFDLAGW